MAIDWNERILELGKPALMDTPTLIEWIQRQLETLDETTARHLALMPEYHEDAVYAAGQVEPIMIIKHGVSPSEEIRKQFEELYRKDSWGNYVHNRVMYLSQGLGLEIRKREFND